MILLLAMLLSHCSSPLLVWQGGGNGLYDVTLSRDRVATYAERAGRWNPSPKAPVTLTLSKERLAALHKVLLDHHACALEGARRLPVPEETSTSLRLDFDDAHCTVEMLSNDWSRTPDAQAVSEALSRLAEEVRMGAR
jgi:hypothetical protein